MDDRTVMLPAIPTPIAPLGVGTWAWGDRSTWGMDGYDPELTEAAIAEAWDASIERLGVDHVDLYQLHGPISLRSQAALAEAFAEVHAAGQATQNAGALGWSLGDDDVAALDAVALEGIVSFTNRFWQHG